MIHRRLIPIVHLPSGPLSCAKRSPVLHHPGEAQAGRVRGYLHRTAPPSPGGGNMPLSVPSRAGGSDPYLARVRSASFAHITR